MILFIFLINIASAATPTPYFTDLENFQNQSLQLKSEQQNLEASKDQLTNRNLFWTPRLAVSANQLKSQLNQTVIDDRNFLSADLSWNLIRGGGDWNLRQAAKAQNRAQELQVANESLRVEVKASDLIFKNIYLLETKRIQDEFLKLKEESLKIVSDRFHQGKIPLQEVTKAEVDVIQQKSKARVAQLDVLENRSQIASAFVTDLQTKIWPFAEKTEANLGTSQKFPVVEYQYWLAQSRKIKSLVPKYSKWFPYGPNLNERLNAGPKPFAGHREQFSFEPAVLPPNPGRKLRHRGPKSRRMLEARVKS
ncbi:MAG: TolC family protein [Bdellovibrionaceae bacterium]|nr:TolC family protein [Pseudobdellovibrionaceae bacterium]